MHPSIIVSVTPLPVVPLKVDHLQSELSDQYLQYREERDARRLLIWQLNDMTRSSVKEQRSADKSTGITTSITSLTG